MSLARILADMVTSVAVSVLTLIANNLLSTASPEPST
jgi:hypothetical protein